MDFNEFKISLASNRPPHTLGPYLTSLWYDGKGDWDKAHQIIQDIEDQDAAHIHAYLHWKEGDISNADYWYRRAARKRPAVSLEDEWQELIMYFLSR